MEGRLRADVVHLGRFGDEVELAREVSHEDGGGPPTSVDEAVLLNHQRLSRSPVHLEVLGDGDVQDQLVPNGGRHVRAAGNAENEGFRTGLRGVVDEHGVRRIKRHAHVIAHVERQARDGQIPLLEKHRIEQHIVGVLGIKSGQSKVNVLT